MVDVLLFPLKLALFGIKLVFFLFLMVMMLISLPFVILGGAIFLLKCLF
jgi:hypothetical protein